MLTVFVVLAAAGFVIAIGSGIWWVIRSGQKRVHSGSDVGAEIMSGLGSDEDGGQFQVAGASRQAFKGKGIKVESETETTFGEMKQQLAAGRWRETLPPLLVAIGVVSTVLFGSLALFVGLEDKFMGGILAAIGVYTAIRLLRNFLKA